MSASTIARWNAIPLERPADTTNTLKRTREDDDDDDMSLVSRSPSPRLDAMDVDSGLDYNDYPSGPAHEVITVDTKIKPSNLGFAMLSKLGWSEGQPLGLQPDARVDPIPFNLKQDLTGVGKISQDVRMIETTVSQRRGLTSERMQKETFEQREEREHTIAKRTAVQQEISETLRAFYCGLCDKQFKNVAQYDEHTNSYAHHHKARAKDMQASVRMQPQEEIERRKEKERRREEKELRKLAKAQGIKMTKPALAPAPAAGGPVVGESATANSGVQAPMNTEHPETPGSGRANTPSSTQAAPAQGFKKGGWATIGNEAVAPTHTAGTHNVPANGASYPAFRQGGQLAASGDASPSPQSVPSQRGGWAPVSAPSNQPSTTGPHGTPSSATAVPPPLGQPAEAQSRSAASRNSWQNFKQKGARGRR